MGSMAELLREGLGQADATGQLLKNAAMQPVAGLGGLGRVGIDLLRGKGVDKSMQAGARTVDDISSWGGPFTRRGAERLQGLGETVGPAIEKVGNALGNPIDRLGEVPVVGPGLAAGALGFVETADPTKTIGKAARAGKAAARATEKAAGTGLRADITSALDRGYDPAEIATRYPRTAPGEMVTDKKTGKQFLQKVQSEEGLAVAKARQAAQKEIDAGNYEPYFPVEERFHIKDTSRYPLAERTTDVAMPKKQATVDKFKEQFDTPETRQRLMDAFNAKKDDPLAHNWYAMGQLEDAFVKELGPQGGAEAFRKNFSQPMAATTGGADPNSNLMMAQYGNFLRNNNLPMPEGAYDMPYPIGGRYASGNMDMYDKVINQGRGLSAADQPKRHNFSANFEGHTDRSTMDEQMMKGFDPSGKLAAPPGASYGVVEGVTNDLANQMGVAPADFQGVAWTGLKGVEGFPMIQQVNEAIERTHRITGKPKADIVRDSFVKGTHPLYGVAGAGAGTAALLAALRGKDEEEMQ